jgi:hypothetical protein
MEMSLAVENGTVVMDGRRFAATQAMLFARTLSG